MAVGEITSGVLAGFDGYLFLAGGAHDVLACATGARAIEPASVANFEANISRRSAIAAAHGASYLHVLFPDKHTVLPDFVPFAIDPLLPRFLDHLAPETRAWVLDPREAIAALPSPAFPRADTHLNDRATVLVAALVVERLSDASRNEVELRLAAAITRQRDQVGDLGCKLNPPIEELMQVFGPDDRIATTSNNMQGGNNGIVDLHAHAGAPDDARLLIFGDSFSRRLAYALALNFREVLFCRSPFLHDEILMQMQPDYVVTANVERYLLRVPRDNEAPNFLLYPWISSATCRPDEGFATALSRVLSHSRTNVSYKPAPQRSPSVRGDAQSVATS